jgi:hypothetical protein
LLGIAEVCFQFINKFIRAQLHFVTAQLAILHNYNNFHAAQMALVAGSKNKFFRIGFQTAQPKKRAQAGYSAFDTA